jgi:subtilisin family serine protease
MSVERAPVGRAPVGMARAAAVVVLIVTSAGCGVASLPAAAPGSAAPASPYIVVLESGPISPAVVAGQQVGFGEVITGTQVFSNALQGYTAELTSAGAAELRDDDRVVAVEPDRVVELAQTQQQQVPTGVRRIFGDDNPALDIDSQDDARVDVDVAVLDSGIGDHSDLDVVARADCNTGGGCIDDAGYDETGHGTHVAGTIAALDNDFGVVGVAPGARLHSVKVCSTGDQCLLSAIVAGVDYVTAHAGTIEVANMSLAGRGSSTALDQAITGAVDAGVVPVVSAGNEHSDVAGYLPGHHPDVVTVSALADGDGEPEGLGASSPCGPLAQDDVLADFSNFGTEVEVSAPGVCILSTGIGGGYEMRSGTSMAAPHVAGAAALLARGAGDPLGRTDVMAIRQAIVDSGNLGWFDTSNDGVQEPLLDLTSFM